MRVVAIDPRTGDVLDWDVPCQDVTLTRSLNMPSLATIRVPAEYHALQDENGHPLLLRHGTMLAVEEDDGTVTPLLMDDESLTDTFEAGASGVSSVAWGTPWLWAPQRWSGTDALAVWRLVWDRLGAQSGLPRFELTGDTSSGVTLGRAPSAEWSTRAYKAAQAQTGLDSRDARVKHWEREMTRLALAIASHGGRKSVGEITHSEDQPTQNMGGSYRMHLQLNGSKVARVWYWKWSSPGVGSWYYRANAELSTLADQWIAAQNTRNAAQEWFLSRETYIAEQKEWMEAHPEQGPETYELTPWGNRDLSSDLEDLRELAGVDWYETARWDGQDRLVPQLAVKKRLGTIRDDLFFELGVNLVGVPELSRGDLATRIHVVGAGEGPSTLSADRTLDHPRMIHRHRVVSDGAITTRQMVNSRADHELRAARAALQWRFTGLVVRDSPAAPIDSLNLGDYIDVRGTLPDGTDLYQRVRILELTRSWSGGSPGDTIEIEVEP